MQKENNFVLNSIDNVVNIKRLPIIKSYAKGIYLYGASNLYPYIVKELIKRSVSATTATNTLANFIRGEGFENIDNSLVINKDGLDLFGLLRSIAKESAEVDFALHLSYNRFGQIVDITPINYEFIRKKIKTTEDIWEMFQVKQDWSNQSFFDYMDRNKPVNYYAFNPGEAKKQIKQDGFNNYKGQIYYHKKTTNIYPLAVADSILDFMQIEAETATYSLSNLQNGFSMSGIMKYPATIQSNKPNKEFEKKLKINATGANNAGRFISLPIPPNTTIPNFFESITANNVDSLFTLQIDRAEANIHKLYQQPSIINGISESGMFNQESMLDAYTFYNSVTRINRLDIENALNKIFSYSIYNVSNLKIKENEYTINNASGSTDL